MQTYEKIITVSAVLLTAMCLSTLAGPIVLKDDVKVAERKADVELKASTNYLSPEAYTAQLEAANNVAQLKAILIKKDASDKFKEAKLKEKKDKVKEGKSK